MVVLKGIGASRGIAAGKLAFYSKTVAKPEEAPCEASKEIARFEAAKTTAINQLNQLYDKAKAEVGEAHAAIFEIHQMMIDDGDFCNLIKETVISEKVSAEYAVNVVAGKYSEMFAEMSDEYMQGRAADVKDIEGRLLNILSGSCAKSFDEPVILAADDLSPSEVIQLDKEMILAIVTKGGTINSHGAILARMMNIPLVIGAGNGLNETSGGKDAVVDGTAGLVYIEPDSGTYERLTAKANDELERKRLLDIFKDKGNISLDGREISIFANIGSASDADAAIENGAGGIGIFRTEFLYLNSKDYPAEDALFEEYKTVIEKMAGKKVVIRTIDIGADKQTGYFDLPEEKNPAMGLRAVRICLERPKVFKTQLRAILRASAFGKAAIIFPMITSVKEVCDCKEILNSVKAELDTEGIAYDRHIETGIMIETPAAALISDLLAKEVDFLSIGTNDLAQYTLALDRQNPYLERFYDPYHFAVLRMIKIAADNARNEGKRIGVCGELAADFNLTGFFLAIGIDELSVSPPFILPLKEKVCGVDASKVNLKPFYFQSV
jgi:phosphotransferase system enzyme I (PtsI)